MMQPMFHRQRLSAMGDKMIKAGQHLLERCQKLEQQTLNLDAEMMDDLARNKIRESLGEACLTHSQSMIFQLQIGIYVMPMSK